MRSPQARGGRNARKYTVLVIVHLHKHYVNLSISCKRRGFSYSILVATILQFRRGCTNPLLTSSSNHGIDVAQPEHELIAEHRQQSGAGSEHEHEYQLLAPPGNDNRRTRQLV